MVPLVQQGNKELLVDRDLKENVENKENREKMAALVKQAGLVKREIRV